MKKCLFLYNGMRRGGYNLIRRLFLLFCLCSPGLSGWTFAQVPAPAFTVNFKNSTLSEVFEYLGKHSQMTFVYNTAAVKSDPCRIDREFRDAPLKTILEDCLSHSGFRYEQVGTTIVIKPKPQAVKEYRIQGKVVNEKNEPLPGVTVRVEGTSAGVASDLDGNFTLRLPIEKGILRFTFIGYKEKKVPFAGTKPLTVKMEENVAALDEVQVIAYGSQKKRTMVSAISSVKADDIKELPTHSLENLLQGHMAGVEVNNVSGSPGGGGSVIAIRGYNSFMVRGAANDNEGEGQDRDYGTPLYVVDGVPIQAFTSPITGTNTLSNIDPSMIESIEVLKDAASAAIYGSRAGNGVVLITTKKGKAGKALFTANMSYSASWLPSTPVQTGGNAERKYHIQGLRNAIAPYINEEGHWVMPVSYEEIYNFGAGSNKPMFDWFWGDASGSKNAYALQDSLNSFYNNSTDWWKYTYRTAKVLNANIQASGGSDKFRYMIGAGYYSEEGIAIGSDYRRVNVLTNLTAFPSKRLRIDNQISLTYTDRSKNTSGSASKIEGVSVDPRTESTLLPGESYVKEELLERLRSVAEKNHGYGVRYNLVLDYEILKDLHLKVTAGGDFDQQNQNTFEPSTMDKNRHLSLSTGSIGRNISLLNENLLSYRFTLYGKHNFDLLAGLSFQKDQYFSNDGSGKGGPDDKIHYVQGIWGNGQGLIDRGGGSYEPAFGYSSNFEEQRMMSYFGRLSYNFKEKYMFETTIRRDGSSVFGEKVRWATFPSFALGWAFSEEPFLKPLYWLSFGKVRASWGKSGQKFSQPYLAQGLMKDSQSAWMGQIGMQPDESGGVINRKLTWEETSQYDFGLDLNFLDHRLKMTLDYYYRYTKGQLRTVDIPGDISLHTFQWQNGLDVSNEGLEMELTADIFRQSAVSWRMKFNISRNWNRFEKTIDGYDYNSAVIGKPLNQIKAYKAEGFYNSLDEVRRYYQANGKYMPLYYVDNVDGIFFQGMRRLVDLNGDGKISEADTYYAASPLPLAHGGIINEIRWKQFDLNIFFNYSLGRHIIKQYDDLSLTPSAYGGTLMLDFGKATFWEGPESVHPDYPRLQLYDKNNVSFSGNFDCDIEKVNMIRLKQLTLGYNLHEKAAKRMGISGARLFLTCENLFILTNYSGMDPEIVDIMSGKDLLGSYPLPRKFTVGLTLNF